MPKGTSIANQFFSSQLIDWYGHNRRDLPWRNTTNPYFILLSEIILQQTRVEQGMPYYLRFIENFPTVADLATAPESQVLRLWQGLGYYSRARNLHTTAKQIVSDFEANVPHRFEDLIKLKGIGIYTASAIASFAYNQPHAVVDGNVFRVLSRVFGVEADVGTGGGVKIFQQLASELLPIDQISTYNQAIMEFGAMWCTPRNPLCDGCIFETSCVANKMDLQKILPIKTKKIIKKNRYLNYIVFKYKDQFGASVRSDSDIWKGLYDFWLLENFTSPASVEQVALALAALIGDKTILLETKVFKHILTHQVLYAKFFIVEISEKNNVENDYGVNFYSHSQLEQLPKSILITRFLEQYFFS